MTASSRHPGHCVAECSHDAGPSTQRTAKRPRRRSARSTILLGAAMLYSLATGVLASPVNSLLDTPRDTLAQLVQRRHELVERQGSASTTPFSIGVTPPTTCEQMNITFSTQGGKPPYTIVVGFDNWYAYTVSLPATYADANVGTWMYPFQVPSFTSNEPDSKPNPTSFVAVGDSTGALLNTSVFQAVTVSGKTCASAPGTLDFLFYTDNDLVVCQDLGVHWFPTNNGTSNTTVTWTDPLNAYMMAEQSPPVHIPVTNSSTRVTNFTLAVEPGTKVMFHMTDKNGQGGVSGVNVAGGSEYVSQDCLTKKPTESFGLPTPTTVLNNARMPDFTATVSSTVTGADGSVSTSTSIEQVHRGSVVGPDLGTGQIAGLSVGVAIAAALFAAFATWYIWRRRHGRGIVFWDMPKDADDDLSKSHLRGPTDRNFLKEQSSRRQHSSTSSSVAPMLALSPTSDSSDERNRQRVSALQTHEGRSFVSDAESHSPTDEHPNQSSTLVGTYSAMRVSSGSNSSNPFIDRQPSHSRSQRQRFAQIAESDQDVEELAGPYSSAASYGPVMARGNSSDAMLSDAVPMVETSYMTANLRTTSNARPQHNTESGGRGAPEYVRHRDAGLLMDDSLEHEDAQARIELPPEYRDVPSSRTRGAGSRREGDSASQQPAPTIDLLGGGVDDGDLGGHPLAHTTRAPSPDTRRQGGDHEDEDESEFWREG